MNKEQAIEVLETMQAFYPNLNMDKRKARVLIPELVKMDYHGVMKNLSEHVANYPYPPTIAEIAVYPPPLNEYVEESIRWEKEAEEVPEELWLQLQIEFEKLVKKLDGDRKL